MGVSEAHALAAKAVTWLERGLSESDLRQALLSERPRDGVRSAVGFLRYRLIQKLPEPEPRTPQPYGPPPVRELLECQGPGEKHLFRPLADETECAPCCRCACQLLKSAARVPEAPCVSSRS
ncbi:hypothetical protein ACFWOJ_16665 [Streptomyces sp. NPDC058439]|uniref:hypothetical protein n=1 Tax=Streptomyces sp. NPDC058439 TaxID=3346500 RepID=UPI003646FCAF